CAPVDRMEPEGVDVVREATRAADARDEREVLARDAELGQDLLDLREDGVVAAAGTPADVLVGDEILLAELGLGRAHRGVSPPGPGRRAGAGPARRSRTP